MKAWVKVAILGGLWGFISGIFVLIALLIAFGHRQPFASKIIQIVFLILFLPGSIAMTIMDLMNYTPYLKLRLIFIWSTLIGVFLGLAIYKLYKRGG